MVLPEATMDFVVFLFCGIRRERPLWLCGFALSPYPARRFQGQKGQTEGIVVPIFLDSSKATANSEFDVLVKCNWRMQSKYGPKGESALERFELAWVLQYLLKSPFALRATGLSPAASRRNV